MLTEQEQRVMDALYTEQSIAADRLCNDTPALRRFTTKFNQRCGNGSAHRSEYVGQCLLWMRKRSLLSPLGDHKRSSIKVPMPSAAICRKIKEVYRENDYPSDRLRNNARAMRAFTEAVNNRTGEKLTPDQLGCILFRLRKDVAAFGEFPKLGKAFKGPRY